MSGTKGDFRRHDVVETSKHVYIDGFPINYVTYVKEEMLDTVGIHEVTLKFIVNSFKQTNDDEEKANIKQPTAKQEKSDNYIAIASIVISLLAMAISVITMIFA